MTSRDFDKDYWERHWTRTDGAGKRTNSPVNPYIDSETRQLISGTALDAGCGSGAEAIWLARNGWKVTGVDTSRTALAMAAKHTRDASIEDLLTWVEADLTTWEPHERWDLVVTNYAHPTIPQLEFYRRIASWVTPGGALLIVGHLHDPESATSHQPREVSATLGEITELFISPAWEIETARQESRLVTHHSGAVVTLSDVIVRAHRNS